MTARAFIVLLTFTLLGCPGGDGGIGATCDGNSDCDGSLQCVSGVCVPRCQRAPECGDGYACDSDGYCVVATGDNGDACHSEVDCAAGLACQLDGTSLDDDGLLTASCTGENSGKPASSACDADADCRNGTCALGRCVDLCTAPRDCASGTTCMTVPRVDAPANGAPFSACLPARGNLVWSIPIASPTTEILFPVPSAARSATLVFSVDDRAQKVGAARVYAPGHTVASYAKPCQPNGTDIVCTDEKATNELFANPIRHLPLPGQSVLQLPSSDAARLEAGAYRITVSSFRANGSPGSAIPRVTAVLKMDTGVNLDVHFHFLDLDDHPCKAAFGDVRLDAAHATEAAFFQTQFLGELRSIFANGGILLGDTTYDDLLDHPDLDGLSVDNSDALFSLGTHAQGVDVYFVRSLSPVGFQAYGPNPGPGGLAGTRQSGIAIAVDTLCYRTWPQLARLTAHEIARYMGLYHNVELEQGVHPTWQDGIADSDLSPANLMFFSELGGRQLSAGQRDVLTRSTVLR